MKKIITVLLSLSLIFAVSATAFAAVKNQDISVSYNNIKVYVDNKLASLKDASGNQVEPFIYNGTTYLPVRAVSDALGKEVSWDQATSSVYIGEQPSKGTENKAKLSTKVANSQIGKACSTQWFDFTIQSVKSVSEYAGHKPAAGNKLVDVTIVETSTYDKELTMGTFDFYMDAASFDDYIYPLAPLDKTMMPASFKLKKGQRATYHIIYEIPASAKDPVLCYTAMDDTNTAGKSFVFPSGI